jgi:leucyl/phenylalanyl-tRNA--protein transferase
MREDRTPPSGSRFTFHVSRFTHHASRITHHAPMPARFQNHPLSFPDPRLADAEGLVAVGGDLAVPRLLAAYRAGIFPWTTNPVTWWSPDPRAIFELNGFHLSRSLARVLRQGVFQTTIDRAFRQVMEGCAVPGPGRGSTWITPEFIEGYTRLHEEGHAHSLECWQGGQLVGGIYGVAIGGLFAGESMFHRASNASKVALFHLIEHLRACGFVLFDIQMLTPTTVQLGATTIPREEYLRRLARATVMPERF